MQDDAEPTIFENPGWILKNRGRCASCGFFGKHALVRDVPTPNYYECDNQARLSGRAFQHPAGALYGDIQTEPVCFVGKIWMVTESANEQLNYPDREHALKAVIDKPDRNCSRWYPYTPSFGPKEHLEEFKMQQLEQDRREFQRKLSDTEQRSQSRAQKVGVSLTIAAIILALGQVLTMTSESLLWKIFSWLFSGS